jgi:small subunit ribosomal protein S21
LIRHSPETDLIQRQEVQQDRYKFHRININLSPSADPVRQSAEIFDIINKPHWQVGRWDSLAEVRVQEGEPLENALRRFKRKVQQEDIIKEVKRHSYYLKPGEKRRVKAALARKRNRKKARKEAD